MSFFNSIHFILESALWIGAYLAFVRTCPNRRPEGFLLAMSLWWTHSFFKIEAPYLLFRLAILSGIYYLGVTAMRKPFKLAVSSSMIGIILAWWVFLRFPHVLGHFNLPVPSDSEFLRQRLFYFVGIPFTVCRVISFVVDSRSGKVENPGLLKFLLYICYFPTLMSGPVTNYTRFTKIEPPLVNLDYLATNVVPGVKRIILGIFKRQLLATFLWSISLPFIKAGDASIARLWIGAYAYYVYLFVDFSGYTDLAVGISKIMNVNLPENFNFPFLARNPRDFWQRWHISFLDWLNQYVLTPVYTFELKWLSFLPGGLLSLLAILITFVFAGVWHGEGTRFLIYGIFNALMLWAYRTYDEKLRMHAPALRKRLLASRAVSVVSVVLCFHYVVFALMLFSLDRPELRAILGRMWNG
ncbi:MAG: MBOAT family O-acyltransferase [Bdellovibrionota bacterium]